jgi:hypothetical protein
MSEEKNITPEVEKETKVKLSAIVAKNAKEVFKSNPEAKKVFAFEDGSIFLEKDKTYANNHSMRDGAIKRVKPLVIIEILRSEV